MLRVRWRLLSRWRPQQLEETPLRLAEASETKDRFLAALSHELRAPLTAILRYAALVRKGKLDEVGVRRALEVIERNAKLQTQLIEDLLDVSRIISGSLRLQIQPIVLGPVIEAAGVVHLETWTPCRSCGAVDETYGIAPRVLLTSR